MITRAKNDARRFLEGLRGSPLTFGRMIASVRLADEIPQAELARRLGLSRANPCDIEKGRRSVTVKRAVQFARILGYSVNQFVAVAVEDQLRKAGFKYRRKPLGWAIALFSTVFWTASAVTTFAGHDMLQIYRQMGFSEQQMQAVQQVPQVQSMVWLVTLPVMTALLAFLLYTKKFFSREGTEAASGSLPS